MPMKPATYSMRSMADILLKRNGPDDGDAGYLLQIAADEIDRLRAELAEAKKVIPVIINDGGHVAMVTRDRIVAWLRSLQGDPRPGHGNWAQIAMLADRIAACEDIEP